MLTTEDLQLLIAGFTAVILYTLWPTIQNLRGRFLLQKQLKTAALRLGLRVGKRPEAWNGEAHFQDLPLPLRELPRGTAWLLFGTRQGVPVRYWVDLEAFVDPQKPRSRILWRLTAKALWKKSSKLDEREELLDLKTSPKGRDYPLALSLGLFQDWIIRMDADLIRP